MASGTIFFSLMPSLTYANLVPQNLSTVITSFAAATVTGHWAFGITILKNNNKLNL